ncbi:MAG: GNAT family N-acetyltransferase [Nesterenkonia sp.]|uniref:GNAT family N-acetyltransferase n=1 Tax=Nesterenkonia marinintestina TaxID=2979865 RepID=UPI0021BEE09B|nr:GNAT family N-acetyltransferase [Nesterenkonia sp. GX14115]MDO5492805.1 GNAT family N-acetyltransferase [Nesterenkonia sp.]
MTRPPDGRIRPAQLTDHPAVCAAEQAAGKLFLDYDLVRIAEDEPVDAASFRAHVEAGSAYVWEVDDVVVGYLLLRTVDDSAHIEQVTVHPQSARRRIGAALVDFAETWARRRGLAALTLTTFTEIPWNGPYYRRLGFTEVAAADQGPELAAQVEHEASLGLTVRPRAAMRRELGLR